MDAFPTTRVQLRPSRQLRAFIITTHLATALALLLTSAPWWLRSVALAMIVVSVLRAWRRHVRGIGDAVIGIEADSRSGWRIGTAHGGLAPARLCRDNLVLPWLTILRFEQRDGQRRVALLLRDNVAPEDFRRIRVLARAGVGTASRNTPR
jgi:hypothetical protein